MASSSAYAAVWAYAEVWKIESRLALRRNVKSLRIRFLANDRFVAIFRFSGNECFVAFTRFGRRDIAFWCTTRSRTWFTRQTHIGQSPGRLKVCNQNALQQ